MSEKQLGEAAWKAFVGKSSDYKDSALLKAMAALARAGDPADQLAALDDIGQQADVLRKAHKADKALTAQLDDIDKALARQRKASEQALKQAHASDDEEEDSPALLSTKLIPLLRELRKGDAVMPTLIAVAGKEAAVLISRRSISPSRGKLLKDFLGVSGSIKFVRADCRFENQAHTFVLQAEPAAGLAKKLRAALLAQTDMKLKVRVRGEDPADVDEDGDDAEAQPVPGPQGPGAPSGGTPPTPTPVSNTTEPPPSAAEQAYARRWAALEPTLAEALRKQHPEATKLRAVSAFAADKAADRDHAAALKVLDTLEKLLGAGIAPGQGDSPELRTALDGWKQARNAALLRLKEVVAEMREDVLEDPADTLAQQAELQVNAVMRQLSAEPRSTEQAKSLTDWLRDDEIVGAVDDEIGALRAPLLAALEGIHRALGPVTR